MALVLYNRWRCLFCTRTRIVLDEKGLAYDCIEVNLGEKPAALLDRNPKGEVPVVEEDGVVVYDSHIINEYLEERHPQPPLMPEGAADRARVRLLHDFCDSEIGPAMYALSKQKAEPGEAAARATLLALLGRLEQTLAGREFLLGRFGLADVTLAPWMVRLERAGLGRDEQPPRLRAWIERLRQRASIAENTAEQPGGGRRRAASTAG